MTIHKNVVDFLKENYQKVMCGDANPNGNVYMTSKGGCRRSANIQDMYRCTGCGVWFHKDCILEHFKLEKEHDWGRQEERKEIFAAAIHEINGKELHDLRNIMCNCKPQIIIRHNSIGYEMETE